MASLHRSLSRAIMFDGMNKQQRKIWNAQHGGKHDEIAKHKAKKAQKGENYA